MESKTTVLCRKIKLEVVGDKDERERVITYLKNGMENQNRAMNEFMSALYVAKLQDMATENQDIMIEQFSHVAKSKKGSGFTEDIELPEGLPSAASLWRKVNQDFSTDMKKGLMYGRVSVRNYRDNNPMLVHNDYVNVLGARPGQNNGMYHTYDSDEEFYKRLFKDRDVNLFIKFANNITFQMIFGNLKKSVYLRKEIETIFKNAKKRAEILQKRVQLIEEECAAKGITNKKSEEYKDIKKKVGNENEIDNSYKIGDSSIQFNKKGHIILNMSIYIPNAKRVLDGNTVVGVDLGLKNPAVCALNNNDEIKEYIGSVDDFLRIRTQMQSQRRRLQKSLSFNKGGHGRTKKMKAMNRLRDREHNWVQTYNHMVSKRIVDFAIKHHAKYINLEDLSVIPNERKDMFVLRNWSYYELQQFITYKAQKNGIKVRFVNPAYTSQTCSCCHNVDKEQRKSQSEFICSNPECKNYNKVIEADFNAARNIAMSENFIDQEKKNNKVKSKEKIKKVS